MRARDIRSVLTIALIGALVATPVPQARANVLPTRQSGLGVQGSVLLASVGLSDLFSADERNRLMSGFASRVLIRVQLRREGDNQPVAVAFQRAEIVYDLWDEKFRVRITRGPGTERSLELTTVDQAISAAASLQHFPVAELGRIDPSGRYFLAVRGDLNPISQELLAEMRQWLRQPSGPQRRPVPGAADSFLGSFVTIFINPHIEESEHQVRFVSQTFSVPLR